MPRDERRHARAINQLYRFYAHANGELYRLLRSLPGPAAAAWAQEFPASATERPAGKKGRRAVRGR